MITIETEATASRLTLGLQVCCIGDLPLKPSALCLQSQQMHKNTQLHLCGPRSQGALSQLWRLQRLQLQ